MPYELELKGYSSDVIDHEHSDIAKAQSIFTGLWAREAVLLFKTARERENQHGGAWTNTANHEDNTNGAVG